MIIALLKWSGTELAISPRYACKLYYMLGISAVEKAGQGKRVTCAGRSAVLSGGGQGKPHGEGDIYLKV